MKILVTAFEPFGGETTNPSAEAMARLPQRVGPAELVKQVLPTAFHEAPRLLLEVIQRVRPDAVVSLGQAGGRAAITPERIAINVDDARIADNLGCQPTDEPVFADGPAAYFSTLPVKAMVRAIRDAGLPGVLSDTAGTFVCNHVMYSALYYQEKYFPQMRCGFIHVPFLPSQVTERGNVASMSLADITRGLEAAIGAVAAAGELRTKQEGYEHAD